MEERVVVNDGKYTVVLIDQGRACKALRYGEEWRDLSGDGLIVAMFSRIQELEEENKILKSRIK